VWQDQTGNSAAEEEAHQFFFFCKAVIPARTRTVRVTLSNLTGKMRVMTRVCQKWSAWYICYPPLKHEPPSCIQVDSPGTAINTKDDVRKLIFYFLECVWIRMLRGSRSYFQCIGTHFFLLAFMLLIISRNISMCLPPSISTPWISREGSSRIFRGDSRCERCPRSEWSVSNMCPLKYSAKDL
jgi:hypothetical protein